MLFFCNRYSTGCVLRRNVRVIFKLARMAYRVLHGMAQAYLNQLVPVSDLPSLPCRRRLRSSSTLQLLVPPYIPSDNHRPSFVSCCSIHRLEFIVCLPPVFTISLHVSATAKDTCVFNVYFQGNRKCSFLPGCACLYLY